MSVEWMNEQKSRNALKSNGIILTWVKRVSKHPHQLNLANVLNWLEDSAWMNTYSDQGPKTPLRKEHHQRTQDREDAFV